MDGHRNREPVHKYIEKVRVWRDSSRGNEVILSYDNPGRGRGEFQVNRGTIREVSSSGGRKLKIEYYFDGSKQSFEITRRQRGGYTLHTCGYSKEELGRKSYQ